MKKSLSSVIVFLLLLLPALVLGAPNYIDAPPLTKVIKTRVGQVKSGDVTLPLITWGADIRTIFANGNARNTHSGSVFAQQGLKFDLQREDDFKKQIENYLSGKTPYLRGTLGMINMASEVLNQDPRTKPVIIYQLSESAGGDALVVKSGINNAAGLKGKTIALQAYGPHVDYLSKILSDAGMTVNDVKLKWLPDLTGSKNTPMEALYESSVDAAMVITPDALALTSGGNVGTGSEDSVRGARILLSTKTANRIIADVYAVRSDYFKANKASVSKLVHGLMLAHDQVEKLVANKAAEASAYREMMVASADILLGSKDAVSDAEGLNGDAYHVDFSGNQRFFTDANYPRNFNNRNSEIQLALKQLGLVASVSPLTQANWNYTEFTKGLTDTDSTEANRFDTSGVASIVAKKQQQGTLQEGELFSFAVYFKPNQNSFPVNLYEDAFKKVTSLASTYGGAIITIEGHSDPLEYLRQKKQGASGIVLKRLKQSSKNLSLTRSNAVRDAVLSYAKSKNIVMDESQFATVGHGFSKPQSGMCGEDPCAPKNEQEWHDNMRVEFRIIQVEAESSVFKPL